MRDRMISFLRYKSNTQLLLPFSGTWYVVWGGLQRQDNILHAVTRDQRFAIDFVIMQQGCTHRSKGTRNANYHCWGELIIAPGNGRIVGAVDGIVDNSPGYMNVRHPLGNHVIIDHGNGEYSFLAHMKKSSLKLNVGQRVATGALLGECGNSGASSEPHLHYHMQNSPIFCDGDGLPARFSNYIANGKRILSGVPRRGQLVSQPRRCEGLT